MTSVPHTGREIAREWARRAETCGLSLGVATPVAGALAGVALAGPFALSAALAAITAWRANLLANDPPAYDFYRAAVIRPLQLDLSVFPPSTPQRELAALTDGFSQVGASVQATLRAFERAQGAALRNRFDIMERQLRDATRLAATSASSLGGLMTALTAVDRVFRDDDALSFTRSAPERTSEWAFDDHVLAFLYRSRLPIKDLNRALEIMSSQGDGAVAPTRAIEDLIPRTSDLAGFLLEWQPEVGGRR